MKHPRVTCGCCEGTEPSTPLATSNRPGLNRLHYRVGTHATFLETMHARLSSHFLEVVLNETDEHGNPRKSRTYPLQALKTRSHGDAAIALLDAWATVAHVLAFYQERIANEGYLRTATERRSVMELARLVGYQLRPGVSSSVFLAYTLDENLKDEVVIPKGARTQSLPGPGELPQSFETSEDLKARAAWNNLKPRLARPQTDQTIRRGDGRHAQIYLKGISANLKPNDPLLIDFFGAGQPELFRVKAAAPDPAADRTLVTLQEQASEAPPPAAAPASNLIAALTLPPSVQPANSLQLERSLKGAFLGSGIEQDSPEPTRAGISMGEPYSGSLRQTLASGESSHAALKAFAPELRETLAAAAANAKVSPENKIKVYALRAKASLFGHSHPGTPLYKRETVKRAPIITIERYEAPTLSDMWPDDMKTEDKTAWRLIGLDPPSEQIKPESWIVIERPVLTTDPNTEASCQSNGWTHSIHQVKDVKQTSMSALGVSSNVSLLDIQDPWLRALEPDENFDDLNECTALMRQTRAFTQSEELELAQEPILEPVCGGTDQLIELDGLYEGLTPGRWVIVSGERELDHTSGVRFSELAMIASATQNVGIQIPASAAEPAVRGAAAWESRIEVLPGDRMRTFIKLASKLAYCFRRDSVGIYGNVVKATHGETRREVLGSGDGAQTLQSFVLKQPPLTFVSAPNPSGVDSTLKVYVNDVQWHEADSLYGISATDRRFITEADDEAKTRVIFGNGREGARLPTGLENIRAEYRSGIGQTGNVKAGQISLLTSRPLGVKAVINPLRATGGADRESRDQARKSAPLATAALDRLVSVQDYEDFSRTYAGISKAFAVELTDGQRQLVHVTIAGADDIPIDKNSDLYRNLRQALLDFGDPHQAIQLDIRELMLIAVSARVRILPDYEWETVEPEIRTALLDAFSFERRELGQDVILSEVISVMHTVRGVAYVDVDVLRGIPEKVQDKNNPGQRRLLSPDEIAYLVVQPLKDGQGNIVNEPLTRIRVNLTDRLDGTILPAQLAFLTREVPETLILNQIT